MTESNVRASEVYAGVAAAARDARRADGDYGYLQRPNGERVRSATREEWERHAAVVAKRLDLSATIDVDGIGPVTVEEF